MRLAAAVAVPPSCLIASDLHMESCLTMTEFNHSLSVDSTVVYSDGEEALNLASMLEHEPIQGRLKLACEARGWGAGGDTPIARSEIGKALRISPAAVAKLFNGDTVSLKANHCFAAAEVLHCDARWLATGLGEMKTALLPTDVLDVARLLHKIQNPELRRAALSMARAIASDPLGQMAASLASTAESQRWSASVTSIADGLQAMDDGELKRRAIAWATTAAFNPERLPQPVEETEVPARRATDRRPSKP